ncbi:MAG: dihydropteroate synthase [Chloroflexota bacterium]
MQFPKIMGILNITPDSFSDGGKHFGREVALRHADKLVEEGADIIDIGGESTRPGAEEVGVQEELIRVIPIITELGKRYPNLTISVDTTKFQVAKAAVGAGARIINDVSGLAFDPRIAEISAETGASLVLMHMRGTPRTMQNSPKYDNVVEDVYSELAERIELARALGVKNIIADVGIGFAKSLEHNLELLRNHDRFLALGIPLLLGISRKSMFDKMFSLPNPLERDLPTALMHAALLTKKIDIIRVHNVKNMAMLKKIHQAVSNA